MAFAIPFRKNSDKNISNILEKRLHKPVAFIILPLFALANTAIIIPDNIFISLTANNSLGIIFGLVFGKPLGIFIFSYLAVKIGLENTTTFKLAFDIWSGWPGRYWIHYVYLYYKFSI